MEPLHVRDLMRRRFVSVEPDQPIEALLEVMRLARVRHVPVVSEGILVGLVSYRELIEAAMDRLRSATDMASNTMLRGVAAERVMRGSIVTVLPDQTLHEAATRMLSLRLGCLPVVEQSPLGPKILGMLTESDLLRAAYASVGSRAGSA